MGTKTAEETAGTPADGTAAGGTTGPAAPADEKAGTAGQEGETDPGTPAGEAEAVDEAGDDSAVEAAPEAPAGPSGVGQGAGAVVSAALGIVSLTGGWIGTVASARQSLIGQLRTSTSSSVARMVKEGYGDAWHATAVWAGLFALTALIVGAGVLARPAFGAPGRPQAPWIKSVAWAGVCLGLIGLLLAVLKYTDVLLGLPATG
ncbi:hypothetical protein ACL02U_14285 [Streptomyces sp. MS06]|uniref:hypothetical protein n=1 Tax=Streptomyces sp. MS06 TaxID=3385974 RepID=UPI0039A1829C